MGVKFLQIENDSILQPFSDFSDDVTLGRQLITQKTYHI